MTILCIVMRSCYYEYVRYSIITKVQWNLSFPYGYVGHEPRAMGASRNAKTQYVLKKKLATPCYQNHKVFAARCPRRYLHSNAISVAAIFKTTKLSLSVLSFWFLLLQVSEWASPSPATHASANYLLRIWLISHLKIRSRLAPFANRKAVWMNEVESFRIFFPIEKIVDAGQMFA